MSDPSRFIPIAGDGWKFVLGFAVLGGVVFGVWAVVCRALGVVLLLLAVFSLYFFRDGKRRLPRRPISCLPPMGGCWKWRMWMGKGMGRGRVVRIFLSVLDGHVQRAPAAGQVARTEHRPGSFLDARNPQAPFVNEANSIEIKTPQGTLMIRQIAGFIARRILCWVKPGDNVVLGERVGLIRFGSQVDLYVPPGVDIVVKEGQRVRGGKP
jgi:phosphatidylserine decarboxylase